MIQYLTMGGWMMVPIGLVSILALAIVIEKAITLSRVRKPAYAMIMTVFDHIRRREWESAQAFCRKQRHPLLRIFDAGLTEITQETTDLRAVEESMKLRGDEVVRGMESSLNLLGAIVTILPLMGFLGTMVGLISAFQRWESLGSAVTISDLSGGIYQAMITTAVALGLVIPYFLAHSYFVSQIQKLELDLSKRATEFLARIRRTWMESETPESKSNRTVSIKRPAEKAAVQE